MSAVQPRRTELGRAGRGRELTVALGFNDGDHAGRCCCQWAGTGAATAAAAVVIGAATEGSSGAGDGMTSEEEPLLEACGSRGCSWLAAVA